MKYWVLTNKRTEVTEFFLQISFVRSMGNEKKKIFWRDSGDAQMISWIKNEVKEMIDIWIKKSFDSKKIKNNRVWD